MLILHTSTYTHREESERVKVRHRKKDIQTHRETHREFFILHPLHSPFPTGTHYEEIFKPGPDDKIDFDDALTLVDQLRNDDAYARRIAENGLAFAQTYLIKEVMLVYLRELLIAYKDLFEDMGESMKTVGVYGDSDTQCAVHLSFTHRLPTHSFTRRRVRQESGCHRQQRSLHEARRVARNRLADHSFLR